VRPAPLFLEAAGEEDLQALVDLERRCYSHPWNVRHFRDALTHRGRVLVLRGSRPADDDQRGILAYCVFETVADELHLHNLAVAPTHRRRGLGRRLLGLILALGRGRGARVALLEVRESNQAALRLYESWGFRRVAARPAYYSHPREDALLLKKAGL